MERGKGKGSRIMAYLRDKFWEVKFILNVVGEVRKGGSRQGLCKTARQPSLIV